MYLNVFCSVEGCRWSSWFRWKPQLVTRSGWCPLSTFQLGLLYFCFILNISNRAHTSRICCHLLRARILFVQGFFKEFQIQLFEKFIHRINPIVFNIESAALLKIQLTAMSFPFQVTQSFKFINHKYTLFKDRERISIWNQTKSAHFVLKPQRHFFIFQYPRQYLIEPI